MRLITQLMTITLSALLLSSCGQSGPLVYPTEKSTHTNKQTATPIAQAASTKNEKPKP